MAVDRRRRREHEGAHAGSRLASSSVQRGRDVVPVVRERPRAPSRATEIEAAKWSTPSKGPCAAEDARAAPRASPTSARTSAAPSAKSARPARRSSITTAEWPAAAAARAACGCRCSPPRRSRAGAPSNAPPVVARAAWYCAARGDRPHRGVRDVRSERMLCASTERGLAYVRAAARRRARLRGLAAPPAPAAPGSRRASRRTGRDPADPRVPRRQAQRLRAAARPARHRLPAPRLGARCSRSPTARPAATPRSRAPSASPRPCARSAPPTARTRARSSCPCHRVVATGGKLGGYGGGLPLKRTPPRPRAREPAGRGSALAPRAALGRLDPALRASLA